MIIIGKRIINVDKYLNECEQGEVFYIGVQNIERYFDRLREYDIEELISNESTIMPMPLGISTNFNANGKWIPDKSLPKENRSFETAYHVIDWNGEDHYGTRYYQRKCYQRIFIEPPEVRLGYEKGILISPQLFNEEKNKKLIKHIINMFLEIFGECEILNKEITPKKSIKIEKLSWNVLPTGEYPWDKAKTNIEKLMKIVPKKHRVVISNRHENITYHVPNFMAIGNQGFFGYIVYGFEQKNLYIFESSKPDNATYVFEGNWKDASKLTKSEILNGKLCKMRIIHNEKWIENIEKLLM